MLIQWCIQCKSVPFWMSEGFHSHVCANLAGSAGTCWRCQGLAGVIDALWWCPTITVEMTAAACVMPDRKEHLPTMARFHRRSCFTNAANCGQGEKKNKERNRSCSEHHVKHVNVENMSTCRMLCSDAVQVEVMQSDLLRRRFVWGAAACRCNSCYYISQWHQWTWTVGTFCKMKHFLKCCTFVS